MKTIRNYTTKPPAFPLPWADAWGEDRIGRWQSFTFRGVTQRFRWIKPGRLMMGSPEDEPEREDDELRHPVVLTDGFWLAETACTQALWQAVTGRNPSAFKGVDRPVENVGWDDCMGFLNAINNRYTGLNLRLPTEAEWEYACRAGTDTPFSFGENITPEQVNYDGNFPYHGGVKGESRNETVAVGSLPPNPWGLYEMHGNVWEWCSDWYGDYPTEEVINPVGCEASVGRVLRGGSGSDDGRDVRSARRLWGPPASRFDFIGLRLARGH